MTARHSRSRFHFRPGASPLLTLVSICALAFALVGTLAGCLQEAPDLSPDDLGPQELMVAATLPGSAELSLGRSLGVRFVRPGGDWSFTEDLAPETVAAISGDLPGRWAWGENGVLVFHPDQPFTPNTTYRVSLQPEALAARGLTLRGSRQFDFVAAPFRCESLDLDRRRVGYRPMLHQVQGTLLFNYPVNPAEVAEHLKAQLEGKGAVRVVVESSATDQRIQFRTEDFGSERQDRRLTITVNGDLQPALGGRGLGKDVDQSLTIPALERLQINQVNARCDGPEASVDINFDERVQPEDLRKHLKLEPEVEGLTMTGNWSTVTLKGDFQPRQSYKISIDGALQADTGVALEVDFHRTVTIPDREPSALLAGPGNYLSLRGDGQLAVECVNLEAFQLTVQRVYPNNLVPFLQKVSLSQGGNGYRGRGYGWSLENLGDPVLEKEYRVPPATTNQTRLTAVDLRESLAADSRGIFRVQLSDPETGRRHDSRWLVATDLGLVAKSSQDRVEVAVASISALAPVAGVRVKVLSRNNQELAAGTTDAQGLVSFSGLEPGTPGRQPFVVVATRGDDLSFLAFDETRIPTADLDVGGVHLAEKGYRAFLYGDRDIYRPGETLHLVWMVRDSRLKAAPSLPLNLKILGPGGELHAEVRTRCDQAGCGEYSAELPRWMSTGPYTALLFLGEDQLLGEARFSVEEFMPDRMKVTTRLSSDGAEPTVVGPDTPLSLSAEAVSLFGPPAAQRNAEAEVWFLRTPVTVPGYEQFTFGEEQGDELPPRRMLGSVRTDDQGQASWDVPLPEAPGFQGWLKLNAQVKVTEAGGGRAVSSSVETRYAPRSRVLGLRNTDPAGSDYREPGQPVRFEAVLLDLDGRPLADADARVELLRRRWRTVLRQDQGGRYRYVSEYDEEKVQDMAAPLAVGPSPLTITPTSHGSYRLVIISGDGEVRGSLPFYVYGFGYSPWAMNNPEQVNIKLDRETYDAGGTVTASVEAPFPGLMLVTVEREKVYSRQWVRLQENTGTVRVRLPREAAPNVYLTATLLRPLDQLDPRAPARAFGAQPVFIDRGPRTLAVELEAPGEMRPRRPLTVRVKLPGDGADPATPQRLTVAAVDEGVLQLTDFATPSALDHFLQRRRLAVDSHDIWALLLPEYERVKRSSATGGGTPLMDAARAKMARRLNPLAADRVKPVALWSGLLEGRPGWQEVTFDVPQFNGTLRLMAVATADDRFGSASAQVRVADPLVLSPSLPRFVAPGDRFSVPVPVYNGLAASDEQSQPEQSRSDQTRTDQVQVTLEAEGPLQAGAPSPAQSLAVPRGHEEVAWFQLAALDTVGVARVRALAHAAGEEVAVETVLPVRPAQPLHSKVHSGSLRGEEARIALSTDWLPGTTNTSVTVAANPAAAFGAALPYLLRYPYGCLEQKTSRCFPLIHFGSLAATLAPGQFGEHDGDYFVNSGLDYLATLHRPGLGFVMWPGAGYDSHNPFATVYATHFLVEAQKVGYVVPAGILDDALQVITRLARTARDGWPGSWVEKNRQAVRAYACYVLALAGQPERGAMDQLAQDSWEQLNAAARTHLAGAYALAGNRARFEQLLPAATAPVEAGRSSGFTWYSPARDEAMRLEVLATVDPGHLQVPRLMQRLADRAENGRWYNTQENAFALLALGKLSAAGRLQPGSGQVLVDDQVVGRFDQEDLTLTGSQWAGKTLTIRADGPGTVWYSVLDEGVPLQAGNEDTDSGLVVQRHYLDEEGNPVDLNNLVQGQTIVCRLVLQSDKGAVEDVVISDLVPAGLEIENPRLGPDGGYDWIQKQGSNRYGHLRRDHLEIRDDRLLLFTRANPRAQAFYYTLRAVTAGQFTLPPVRAEAMYDPEVMSSRGAGEIRVLRP